jgi:hypothetical protein
LLPAALVLLGCGGDPSGIDEGPSVRPVETVPEWARDLALHGPGLVEAFEKRDGVDVWSHADRLSEAGTILGGPLPQQSVVRVDVPPDARPNEEAFATCDDRGCTFDGSNTSKTTGTVTVGRPDGSGRRHVTWSFTSGGALRKGDVTVSSTFLEGETGSVSLPGPEAIFGFFGRYSAITFTGACPTAGKVYAKRWITDGRTGKLFMGSDGTFEFSTCPAR